MKNINENDFEKSIHDEEDESDTKDIDKYTSSTIDEIWLIRRELDIIGKWHDVDWSNLLAKEMEHFERDHKYFMNKWDEWNYLIERYIWIPKNYEYIVCVRTFMDILRVYLDKNHQDHKNNRKMWSSSKFLEYWVHLIFKTGYYNNKIYDDKEIIDELKDLMSFLSLPLHNFSIYFNRKKGLDNKENLNKDMNYKVDNIINLILIHSVDNVDVIKNKIDINIEGDKQEYLKFTKCRQLNEPIAKKLLDFIERNCQKEFTNKTKNKKKL